MKRAFTLIELLLVMAIMGMLGTLSMAGFRSMRRGMEHTSVMRNLDQFIHNAYQRAMMDRQPTVVYFWNETRQVESDDGTKSLMVVGRAVAVRRSGRITAIDGKYLIDEFGDLRFTALTDDEGEEDTDETLVQDSIKMRLYKMNGNETGGFSGNGNYSTVSQTTLYKGRSLQLMMTDPDWQDNHSGDNAEVSAYGYYTDDAGNWKIGDAYGLEFAELTLPNNYIFGSSYQSKVEDPVYPVSNVIRCEPGSASGQVTVNEIRLDESGNLKPTTFPNNTSQSADKDPTERNY